VIPKKLFSLLSIFNKFFELSIWISCFRVLFGCNSTFEHPAYLNSGKNDVEAYIYWVLGEIIVLNHKKFQNLNINKSYFCIFDGIRRNFNCRSIYKSLLYALNYIIFGLKHELIKLRMRWHHFMGREKGGC
jgi:hypothetical protein